MSEAESESPRPHKPYCLRCFAPLPSGRDRCPTCDFVSVRSMRRKYWNLHPDLVLLETLVKLGIVLAASAGAIAWWLLAPSGDLYEHVVGGATGVWSCVMFVVVSAAGWLTATKITQRKPYFRPTVFWTAAFGLSALVMLFYVLWISALLVLAAGLVPLLGRAAMRWQHARVATGASPNTR